MPQSDSQKAPVFDNPDRNLAMELVRATEAAAIRAVLSGKPADISHARTMGDETFDSADYAEGRAAFAARRKPVFTGR